MGLVSQKLRDSAKGERCTFNIPSVCNGSRDTTVLCHAPSEAKGMGNKGPDYHAAFGCYDCHQALDQHRLSREDELFYWLRGIERTHAIWIERELVVVPVSVPRQKPSTKILPRRALASKEP